MRFISAFMVLLCHARGYHWVEWGRLQQGDRTVPVEIFYAITRPGNEWVVVFFVLSGFLVGGKVIERSLNGSFHLWSYVIDRVTRVWVPLLPALILTLLIAIRCNFPFTITEFLGNVVGLQGVIVKNFAENEPLWSLSYEIWFYVLIGSIGMILSPQYKGLIRTVILLTLCFAVFIKLISAFLFVWILGLGCFFLVSERRRIGMLLLGIIIAVLGVTVSQMQIGSRSMAASTITNLLPSWDIAILSEGLGIGLLIAAICREAPKGKFMIWIEKRGTPLAAFSYTLYLTHYPILNLWEHFFPERNTSMSEASVIIFLVKVFSCLVIGWLFYLPFEAKTAWVRAWLRVVLDSCIRR